MKLLLSLLILCSAFSVSCGIKGWPVEPQRSLPPPNLDCSIYDPKCTVTDTRYDAACDPLLPEHPPICEIWNQKYDRARKVWRAEQAYRKEARRRWIAEGKNIDKIREEDMRLPEGDWQYDVEP